MRLGPVLSVRFEQDIEQITPDADHAIRMDSMATEGSGSILAHVAHENGVSVSQLASAVSQPEATIREWLAEAAEPNADDSAFASDDI